MEQKPLSTVEKTSVYISRAFNYVSRCLRITEQVQSHVVMDLDFCRWNNSGRLGSLGNCHV